MNYNWNFFIAGWMYGQSNIQLEISDIFEESYSLDLIADMKEITSNKNIYKTLWNDFFTFYERVMVQRHKGFKH